MAAKLAKSPATHSAPTAPLDIETLVKQLVAHARNATPPASTKDKPGDDESGTVLVDYEIDGVRCVLARTASPRAARLSPREIEVARMVAKGYPNKIIASVLDISVWTVSTHLRRMFAKVGVTSRAAMVTEMLKRGEL